MENINVKSINDLIAGKTAIKVGIDLQSALILIGGIFIAVVLAGIVIKLVTKNL